MKMVSLQMKAIKNQLDPHFTLNVLNAIGSLYTEDSTREKADYIFGKYAKLIRQTVISSDKVIVTVGEELDFVRNYIEIEKFRIDKCFNYSINIDQESQLNTKIPRMLIHTFVENAIKYGTRHRSEEGILKIFIQTIDGVLNIIVEDNGKGLELQNSSKVGTGKGLIILQELIDLYYRLENVKITFSVQNIPGEKEISAGTRAIIKVPARNPKQL
jgi:LytS/YehU family sensor histidine kinase